MHLEELTFAALSTDDEDDTMTMLAALPRLRLLKGAEVVNTGPNGLGPLGFSLTLEHVNISSVAAPKKHGREGSVVAGLGRSCTLRRLRVRAESLAALADSLPTLQALVCESVPMDELQYVSTFSALTRFGLFGATGGDTSQLLALGRLHNLTRLDIEATLPQRFIDETLPQLQQLERLDLRRVGEGVSTLAALGALPRLRELKVSDAPNVATLSGLGLCRSLETLSITPSSKIDRLSSLAGATRLTALDLSSCEVTGDALMQLPWLPRLASLVLCGAKQLVDEQSPTAAWWPPIVAQCLPRLTTLDVQDTPLDVHRAVTLLSAMPRLKIVMTELSEALPTIVGAPLARRCTPS